MMADNMRIKIIDEVRFCCKEMEDYYESHDDIKFDSRDKVPAAAYINYKMTYEGKLINKCPFCKAHIEIEISKSHWRGF